MSTDALDALFSHADAARSSGQTVNCDLHVPTLAGRTIKTNYPEGYDTKVTVTEDGDVVTKFKRKLKTFRVIPDQGNQKSVSLFGVQGYTIIGCTDQCHAKQVLFEVFRIQRTAEHDVKVVTYDANGNPL
jgi:hypothetical protein